MSRDTQKERAGFAVEGAGTAGYDSPTKVAPHSVSTTFFAEGERKEREGWDWTDLMQVVPPPSGYYPSFDEPARRRLPLMGVAFLVSIIGAALWLL
jgi:hypothetical protein